jgi:hypothetical protein
MVHLLQNMRWHFFHYILCRSIVSEYISQVPHDYLHATTNKSRLSTESLVGSCSGSDNEVVMGVGMPIQATTVSSYTHGHDNSTSVLCKCKTAKSESELHNHSKRDLKIQVLWDMTPCSRLVKRYWCLGEPCCLHLGQSTSNFLRC